MTPAHYLIPQKKRHQNQKTLRIFLLQPKANLCSQERTSQKCEESDTAISMKLVLPKA